MSEHRRSLGVYEDVLNQLKAKGIRLRNLVKLLFVI